MLAFLFVLCLDVLVAGLLEPLEKEGASNTADCTKLAADAEHCGKVKACIYTPGSSCIQDPCYERLVNPSSDCKDLSTSTPPGPTCVHVPIPNVSPVVNTPYCVSAGRETEISTNELVCNLEWGEYKVTEYGFCKLAGTGCGALSEIQGTGSSSFYLCSFGNSPLDPCDAFAEADCPYIKECMWENSFCVIDPCFERTMTSRDACRTDCEKHILYPGTPQTGYCKTKGHDLASPCNALSQTLISMGVCATLPPLPASFNCTSHVTVNNYEGVTLYVCNPEEKVINGAVSVNSFAVGFFVLILLISML